MLESGLPHPKRPGTFERLLAINENAQCGGRPYLADLQKLLVRGEMPATVHFVLGVDAWRATGWMKHQVHWERANQLDPNSPSIANNLAVVLAGSNSPDLAQRPAGQHGDPIDSRTRLAIVIPEEPSSPRWQMERGFGSGKPRCPRMPSPQLHKLLADTYEHSAWRAIAAESAARDGNS